MRSILTATLIASCALVASPALADPPGTAYIFPAGGQRGTTVQFRVGGLALYEGAPFEMRGPGVQATPRIELTRRVWFEGPVIPLPDSQRQEDYPKDYAGSVTIAADAPLGHRSWQAWNSQGATAARTFIVGELPEIIETEVDGEAIPVPVKLPLTINGRIFPREDIDVWTFPAEAGQSIVCSALAGRLGSPLDPRIEILDPHGRPLAESAETPHADAFVRFTAPLTGVYQARIHDISFGGLQHYVYRLTITHGPYVERVYPLGGQRGTTVPFEVTGQAIPAAPLAIPLPADGTTATIHDLPGVGFAASPAIIDLDEFPEVLEQEPNDDPQAAGAAPHDVPAVFNGRIGQPGDCDIWAIRATKGQSLNLQVRAAQLGSPLDSQLAVLNAEGKELTKADDISNTNPDSQLTFAVTADGVYFLQIKNRLASRGGPAFAYRLRVAPAAATPDFQLQLIAVGRDVTTDALTVNRGSLARLIVRADRQAGFQGEIKLTVDNLPAGVTLAGDTIAMNRPEAGLIFKADAAAKVQAVRIRVTGTATIGDQTVSRTARLTPSPLLTEAPDSTLLAVSVPTPFRVKGVFDTKYAQRGAIFVRNFQIERGDYTGPLEITLADRQARHLQGVTGPTITVPAGATEFDYPVYLPPWMEIGRTSRSIIAAIGIVTDPDGTQHKVSYSSVHQNDQIIVLVDPGQLTIDSERRNLLAAPGNSINLPVRISRGTGLAGPVKIELIHAEHIRGIQAAPLELSPDESSGQLTLTFDKQDIGPFNMPLIVRATALKGDQPVVAEVSIEVIDR